MPAAPFASDRANPQSLLEADIERRDDLERNMEIARINAITTIDQNTPNPMVLVTTKVDPECYDASKFSRYKLTKYERGYDPYNPDEIFRHMNQISNDSVAIMIVYSNNFVPNTSATIFESALNPFITQVVKTYIGTTVSIIDWKDTPSTVSNFDAVYPYPYDYPDAEKNALDAKFGFDTATLPSHPASFVFGQMTNVVNDLSNDLRSGVLSRFDVVKTTSPFTPTKNDFEILTADEQAEVSASLEAEAFEEAPAAAASGGASAGIGGSGGTSGGASGGGSY